MKRTNLRRAALGGAALSALLVTAACSGSDMAGMDRSNGGPTASSSASAAATFNNADVMFAQMMTPHHRQAVAMADLAAARAGDPELKDLAAKIKVAQDPEITTMTGWLTAWGRPTAAPTHHSMPGMSPAPAQDMHGMGSPTPGGSGMPGMMSDQEMAELGAARGAQFDKRFAQMMIAHHNGAIDMAKTERERGSNPAAKALAAKIASDQEAEVKTLQRILDRL
ncbi:DUF305 domain-containing protein [Micromonospora costi]|uniref:DUF305 domain-containing protein n=1 Tax=Micromonospora costi TaxID=1530042 RepID=A0A3A9ZY65_9ACTN|nr:DUF305 domain-containing protein [Micromonospora costi]RKN53004.1 DUF305 domain-containing protein [Micromonospora costi]